MESILLGKLFFVVASLLFTGNIFAEQISEISGGVTIVNSVIKSAKEDLLKRKVRSRAYPQREVIRTVRSSVVHRLFVAENANKSHIHDQLHTLYQHIEKFGMTKLSNKRSVMGACGVMQITKETFESVRKQYPHAGIGKDFDKEVRNPYTAMKIAILVVDNALASIPYEDRRRVMKDDDLYHDFVAAAYNGGPGVAIRLLNKGNDFAKASNGEIKNYIEKVRIARTVIPA